MSDAWSGGWPCAMLGLGHERYVAFLWVIELYCCFWWSFIWGPSSVVVAFKFGDVHICSYSSFQSKVIIYAIVIPIIKLLLTFFGNTLQLERCGTHRTASRRCIQMVQNISKWACPDMFAYIILMHLVRSLTVPPYFKANGRLETRWRQNWVEVGEGKIFETTTTTTTTTHFFLIRLYW